MTAGGQPLGPLPVRPGEEVRPLAPHHHRAGRVDHQHLGPRLHVGQEEVEVGVGLGPQRLEVALLPGRHAAAAQPLHHPHVHAVLPEHEEGVLPDLGVVVLHEAGLEEHHLAARRLARSPCRSAQASNGSAAKSGRSLSRWMPTAFSMRMRKGRTWFMRLAVPKRGPRQPGGAVGIVQHPHPQRLALAAPLLPAAAVHQLGEVELEAVVVARACRGTAPRRACTGSRRPSPPGSPRRSPCGRRRRASRRWR